MIALAASSVPRAPAQTLLGTAALEKISRRLRDAQYRVNRRDEGHTDTVSASYQAHNRGHNLDASFSEAGIGLRPAGESEHPWDWRMSLSGYGYEGAIEPAREAELWVADNRVEYRRGDLIEWYVNDARGLEQGFTLAVPPAGGQRGTLLLELRTTGRLAAVQEIEGASIVLADAGGAEALRYSGLVAWDASGQVLPATMTAAGNRILIRVRDERAVYPLTIDPVFSEIKKLTASDGASVDLFGESVAISGDTIVVGAFSDDDAADQSGSAYVFERNHGGANNWGQIQKLTASDAAERDRFGMSVAISGDTVVVAAQFKDDVCPSDIDCDSGSAYVFERNQGGENNWGEVKKLTAMDAARNDQFGSMVAISGDTVVVGARYDDDACGPPSCNTGSTYVFERNQGGANSWGEVRKLVASDAALGDFFGTSGAMSGDTVVVGAPGSDDACPGLVGCDSGAGYVFERNQGGANNWGEVGKLVASDAADDDNLGSRATIAVFGDAVVVGATGNDDAGAYSGAPYVFVRNQGGANNWGEAKKLTASDAATNDHFGYMAAISADTVVVGAVSNDEAAVDAGAAYVFGRNHGGAHNWGQIQKLTASDAAANDEFGTAGAISGTTLVVGASRESNANGSRAGSVYLYASSSIGYYVLDQLGGVHAGAGAPSMTAPTPYWGFRIAADLELASVGCYVLDGFGGVHAGGGAPALTPPTPYWGWDVAQDLELAATGYYVLDRLGGVHAGGGAPDVAQIPLWEFPVAADLELAPTGYYVLDDFGGVHAGGGAPVLSPPTPYWGFQVAADLELAPTGYYVLDAFGGVHTGAGAPVLAPSTPYWGFIVGQDLELANDGYYVLDRLGGVHVGGGAITLNPPSHYFGFSVARDFEIR